MLDLTYRRDLSNLVKTSINKIVEVNVDGKNIANEIYQDLSKTKDIDKENLAKLTKSFVEQYGDLYSDDKNSKFQ